MEHIKNFKNFNSINEDVYVKNAKGIKKRIYVENNNDGTYNIGCNGTSLHKTKINKESLDTEIEKMKKEIEKERW